MMLCGIKLRLDYDAISQLLRNPKLEFKSLGNRRTKTWDESQICIFNGMKIHIKNSGFGWIKGSLHKYYNGGIHNYDDFLWEEVFLATNDLSERLGISIQELPLVNLEWGVNIKTDIHPKEIISGLVMHKGVRFERMYVTPGTHYTCCHFQFSVKIYDKGTQNRLQENLLRVEIAAERAAYFKKLGVNTLNDLENYATRVNLQNALLQGGWKDLILLEPGILKVKPQNKREKDLIHNWSNPNYWLNLSKRSRCYQREMYDKFRLESGLDVKEKVYQSISEKLRQL